jgi:hypothetical protein
MQVGVVMGCADMGVNVGCLEESVNSQESFETSANQGDYMQISCIEFVSKREGEVRVVDELVPAAPEKPDRRDQPEIPMQKNTHMDDVFHHSIHLACPHHKSG